MRQSSRPVIAALVAIVLVVLLAPDAILWLARSGRQFVLDTLLSVGIPQEVLLGVGFVVLFLVSFLVIFGTLRLFTSVGVSSGSRVAYWYDRLMPDSPRTKAMGLMVIFTVVLLIGLIAFVPYLSASLTEDTDIGGFVDDIREGRYSGAIPGLFEDDAVRRGDGDLPQKQAGFDTDGDGLLDSWEVAGETPSGASLPGADPDQMDLYVQFNFGENVSRLDRDERRQLRTIWSQMPIENPDGSTGIDLHLVHRGDLAGRLDQPVRIVGESSLSEFYTEDRLGSRYCSYHQVTLGQIQDEETIGYADAPGLAAVLDGSEFGSYRGDVSFRVAMVTHALLHNVVGQVSGDTHTDSGWLAYPAPGNEQLSTAVAEQLERDGFVSSSFDRERCGPRQTVTPETTTVSTTTAPTTQEPTPSETTTAETTSETTTAETITVVTPTESETAS